MKKTIAMLMVAIMVSVVVAPTVMASYFIETKPATDITATSATLNGLDKYSPENEVWFEWGETTSSSYGATAAGETSTSDLFTASISGLSPRTTYHYRALGLIGTDSILGDYETFITKATTEGPSANVPEFSTIAIPITLILGLLFFFSYRKRKKE